MPIVLASSPEPRGFVDCMTRVLLPLCDYMQMGLYEVRVSRGEVNGGVASANEPEVRERSGGLVDRY